MVGGSEGVERFTLTAFADLQSVFVVESVMDCTDFESRSGYQLVLLFL